MTAPEIRSVAVVGSGAMGAMYAAHCADAGLATVLVATGERAERLRRHGITVNGAPLRADVVDPTTEAHAPVDLILVAVKDAQLAEAIDVVAPLVAEHTTFLSVLNGLDSEAAIGRRYGAERVPLCIALAMDARRVGNEVAWTQAGRLDLGDDPRVVTDGPSDRVRAVCDALDRAGLAWHTPEDMRRAMWWKFMVNVGINQASAVLRAPYGAFVPDGPARSLMLALQREVIAVANAEGVALGEDDLDAWSTVLAAQPVGGWTSMHQDVEAGRPTEVEIFGARVVELGERHGIPTPHNRTVTWILRATTPTTPTSTSAAAS